MRHNRFPAHQTRPVSIEDHQRNYLFWTNPFIRQQSEVGNTALDLTTDALGSAPCCFSRCPPAIGEVAVYKTCLISPLTGSLNGFTTKTDHGIYLAYPRQHIATVVLNPATIGTDLSGASSRWGPTSGFRVPRRPHSNVCRVNLL